MNPSEYGTLRTLAVVAAVAITTLLGTTGALAFAIVDKQGKLPEGQPTEQPAAPPAGVEETEPEPSDAQNQGETTAVVVSGKPQDVPIPRSKPIFETNFAEIVEIRIAEARSGASGGGAAAGGPGATAGSSAAAAAAAGGSDAAGGGRAGCDR